MSVELIGYKVALDDRKSIASSNGCIPSSRDNQDMEMTRLGITPLNDPRCSPGVHFRASTTSEDPYVKWHLLHNGRHCYAGRFVY
jgi:hypothetical protein